MAPSYESLLPLQALLIIPKVSLSLVNLCYLGYLKVSRICLKALIHPPPWSSCSSFKIYLVQYFFSESHMNKHFAFPRAYMVAV